MGAFAMAWREVRQHPARRLATLFALLISVAVLVSTRVVSLTDANAITEREALWASRADLIVETHLWHQQSSRWDRDLNLQEAEERLRANPNVQGFERFSEMATKASTGRSVAGVMLASTVREPQLQWYTVTQGRAPRTDREIVLTRASAKLLGVSVGDTLHLAALRNATITVVGLMDQEGYSTPPALVTLSLLQEADRQFPPPNVDMDLDPATNADVTPFSSGDGVGIVDLVVLKPGADADKVAAAMAADFLHRMILHADPRTRAQLVAEVAAGELGGIRSTSFGGTGWTANLALGCAAMALVLGGVIISSTFSMVVAQQRRTLGLLRTVGFSRAQVASRVLAEALVLGVIGVLAGVPAGLGVAALATSWSHSLEFGLQVPWAGVAGMAAAGVLAAVVAALPPAVEAGRVSPIEALAKAETGRERVSGPVRATSAVAALLLGVALVVEGLRRSGGALAAVVVGAGLAAAAVLWSLPLVMGPVSRLGHRLSGGRPVPTLAALNIGRNVTRAAAAVAVMALSLGLVVAMQVGAATGRRAAFDRLNARYPVDLTLQSAVQSPQSGDTVNAAAPVPSYDSSFHLLPFAPSALSQVRSTPGIAAAALLPATDVVSVMEGVMLVDQLPVAALTPEAEQVMTSPVHLTDHQLGLPTDVMRLVHLQAGATVALWPVLGDDVSYTVVPANVGSELGVLSPGGIQRLHTHLRNGVIIARLSGGASSNAAVVDAVNARLIPDNAGMQVSGSAQQKATVEPLIDGVERALTSVLGLIALIALVGVSNVLGLSVLERRRESGLLRALGLPASSLPRMLAVEALVMAIVAAVAGGAAGAVAGWVGAGALLRTSGAGLPSVAADAGAVALAMLVTLGAALAASVIPGVVARRTTPMQELADAG